MRELGQYRVSASGGQRRQRTAEVRSKFEPPGTAQGGTQPEVNYVILCGHHVSQSLAIATVYMVIKLFFITGEIYNAI